LFKGRNGEAERIDAFIALLYLPTKISRNYKLFKRFQGTEYLYKCPFTAAIQWVDRYNREKLHLSKVNEKSNFN
jgi:hypothetical protein